MKDLEGVLDSLREKLWKRSSIKSDFDSEKISKLTPEDLFIEKDKLLVIFR